MANLDEMVANGKDRIELGATLKEGGPAAIGGIFAKTEKDAAAYQSVIRDIASVLQRKEYVAAATEHRKPAAWSEKLEVTIADQVSAIAEQEGLDRQVLGPAIGQMLGDLEYVEAMKVAPVLAKFVVGQKADAGASAALVARLNKDFNVGAAAMPAALSRVAAFSKDNGVESTELVKAMQVLLDDLKFMGYQKDDAAQLALAILQDGMGRYGSAGAAASQKHQEWQKALGKGGAAAKAHTMAKAEHDYDLKKDTLPVDERILDRDQAAQRNLSSAKWGQAGQALREASGDVGNVLRPATDAAAEALRELARDAGKLAKRNPEAVQGAAVVMTVVGTVLAAMAARSMASGVISAGKGLFGKDKPSGCKVECGECTAKEVAGNNRPGGGSGGDSGGRVQDRKGASRGAPAAGRTAQVPKLLQPPPGRWARTVARGRAAVAWAGNLANRMPGRTLAQAAMSKAGAALRWVPWAGAALGTYQAADAAFRGKSEEERKRGIKMGAAMAVGALIGGVVVPGVGMAGGAAVGQMLYQMFGMSEAEAKAKAEETKRASEATTATTLSTQAAQSAQAAPQARAAGNAVAPAKKADVNLAAAQPGVALAASAAAAEATRHAARSDASSLAVGKEAAPQAAAVRPQAAAQAVPAPQLHFKPSISITVQGDVREPRRIAEELMPHLRQLFDQFQGQQQRSSLFDAPLTVGGIAP
jgi:hypothetical protein